MCLLKKCTRICNESIINYIVTCSLAKWLFFSKSERRPVPSAPLLLGLNEVATSNVNDQVNVDVKAEQATSSPPPGEIHVGLIVCKRLNFLNKAITLIKSIHLFSKRRVNYHIVTDLKENITKQVACACLFVCLFKSWGVNVLFY